MQGKDRSTQIIALVALIVAVFGLTVGFAAFTTTLTIRSGADVTRTGDVLNVVFSTSGSSAVNSAESVTATVTGTGATAETATLNALTVTNLFAHFTNPGQSAEYNFFVYNDSAYTAYLTGVTFAYVTGSNPQAKKVCTANNANSNPATQNISAACDGITLTLELGQSGSSTSWTDTPNSVSGHSLTAGSSEPVKVTIEYASGSAIPDGDITVAFGDITLSYSSVSGS